jgi:basic membrane protein A
MKKLVSYGLIAAVCLSVVFIAGITPISAKPVAGEYTIGVIFATGGLGDLSFNDAAYQGMQDSITKYAGNNDINVSFIYREPTNIPEFETYQEEFASNGSIDLIICVGFLQTSALNITAQAYPSQKFVLIDDVLDLTNVNSITFKEHEGSFLVGAMAAFATETDKLGFLGGLDIYLINKFRAGYEQGAKFVNPDIEITAKYSPNPDNPWGDLAGGKEVAETLYGEGIDVIYAAAGGTGIGVFEAANETTGALAIGVDSDQDYIAPGKVLCSMLKKVETAVSTSVDALVEGTWEGGASQLGLAEDGVGISNMTYTESYKNKQVEFDGVTKSAYEHIQDIRQQIIDGDIVVGDIPEAPAAAPGFTLPIVIFALIPVTIMIRRRKK